jgi:glycosyltransferase involved in cell wall biosynthesis
VKRIQIFTGCFYPHIGGAISDILEISRRLVKRGYEIDIIACNTRKVSPYEQLEGINIYRLDSWNALQGEYPIPKPTLRNVRTMWNMLKKKHDIVHVYTRFYINSSLGLVFSRLKRVPLLYTELGTGHNVSSSKIVNVLSRAYDHTLGTLLVKLASRVTVESQSTISFLRHLGLKKEAIVIPCGVDMNVFRHRENNLKEKLNLGNAVIITSVSRLIYAKGVEDLILALPKIKREIPQAKILIVGTGDYENKLRALAQEMGRGDVQFLGEKNQQEVAEILSITDIAVCTSYSESLSSSILEYAAMGLPIVATNIGGTPEVIQDGEVGLIFEPRDIDALVEKVCNVAKNKRLAKKLGNNAKRLIKEKFNWDNIVQLYCEVMSLYPE